VKGLSRFVSWPGRTFTATAVDKVSLRLFARHVPRGGIARKSAVDVLFKIFADGVSKMVTLVVMVAAARVLSAADFGVLALAMTTGWILSVASDAGLPIYLAKLVAQTVARQMAPLAAVIDVMRTRIAFAAIAAIVAIALASAISPQAVIAFAIVAIAQLLNAVLDTLSHAYRGLGRTNIESTVVLSHRTATAAAVIVVLAIWPSLTMLSLALAVPPAIALLVSWQIARTMTGGNVDGVEGSHSTRFARSGQAEGAEGTSPGARRFVQRHIVTDAAPLGIAALLSAAYFRCDVYFVQAWHGVDTVGVYNAAFRIVEALRIMPAAVLAVSFATLCASQDLRTLQRLTALLLAGGLALCALLYVTAPTVLQMLYGDRFVEGAPALRMLSAALPLFFVNYALTHQVIAWDGQRMYVGITATALVANLAANVWLIPDGGMVGAAIATLLTEVIVTVGCVMALSSLAPADRQGQVTASLIGDGR
jgi:O-antigen/teichoic acid export membrane protein